MNLRILICWSTDQAPFNIGWSKTSGPGALNVGPYHPIPVSAWFCKHQRTSSKSVLQSLAVVVTEMHDLTSMLNHYQLKLVQHARVINWKVSCAKAGCQITRNDYVDHQVYKALYILHCSTIWSVLVQKSGHGIPPFGDHKILWKYDVLNHQVLVYSVRLPPRKPMVPWVGDGAVHDF